MTNTYMITQEELDKLTVCIEEIDIAIGEIINRGIPKEYEEFLLEKLGKIEKMNSLTGRILDVWVDE